MLKLHTVRTEMTTDVELMTVDVEATLDLCYAVVRVLFDQCAT